MDVVELKCFGTRAGEGNSALVIRGDHSDEAARLAFAKASGKPACVFIGDDQPPTLDYFYPHMRSPLCLHATLAAARVLLKDQPGPITVRTAVKGQELALTQQDGIVYAQMNRQPVPQVEISQDLPSKLLGNAGIQLASAPTIASVGSPKLLLEVRDSTALQALKPDLAAIAAWGKTNGVSGCYAWCRREDGSLEGRNFNHLDPKLEDAATGVAAGALTVLLNRPIRLYQGANMGQPCLLRTTIEGENILVGGAAETV
ncbi:PhzF family phenazine biosynthesis protein [Pseudoduganella sp. RAF19]|uniref:PhzF family phenazine biosynthesis protein n=1 Tax=Pseudoduganella sp. RAF19 TaxID=3233052 RepID=UPI003F993CCE